MFTKANANAAPEPVSAVPGSSAIPSRNQCRCSCGWWPIWL